MSQRNVFTAWNLGFQQTGSRKRRLQLCVECRPCTVYLIVAVMITWLACDDPVDHGPVHQCRLLCMFGGGSIRQDRVFRAGHDLGKGHVRHLSGELRLYGRRCDREAYPGRAAVGHAVGDVLDQKLGRLSCQ